MKNNDSPPIYDEYGVIVKRPKDNCPIEYCANLQNEGVDPCPGCDPLAELKSRSNNGKLRGGENKC